jgi:hypothetical protein
MNDDPPQQKLTPEIHNDSVAAVFREEENA